jgi:hypothetical protein
MKQSFTYLIVTISGILLSGTILASSPFGPITEVFSQMQMNRSDMIKDNATAMKTGQQMKGMEMGQGQQMKGMEMGQMMMMPPQYSTSTYHMMSSVNGIQISGIDIVNDKELLVKIKSNSPNPVNQNLTLVGGGGDLAGSTLAKAGWKDSNTLNLKLQGTGSLYNLMGIHLHLFP